MAAGRNAQPDVFGDQAAALNLDGAAAPLARPTAAGEDRTSAANTWPDFTTNRPFEPLYLPTSTAPLTVSDGPSRISEARLLPPSATLKWFTSTFVCANITWLGLSCVPLIRASAVRDGSVPPHRAASSQLPLPPFQSTVVPAHDAVAPATVKRPAARPVTV